MKHETKDPEDCNANCKNIGTALLSISEIIGTKSKSIGKLSRCVSEHILFPKTVEQNFSFKVFFAWCFYLLCLSIRPYLNLCNKPL